MRSEFTNQWLTIPAYLNEEWHRGRQRGRLALRVRFPPGSLLANLAAIFGEKILVTVQVLVMDMSTVFESDFLKCSDLKGRQVTLTIAAVEVVEFDDGSKPKVSFTETEKQFIANKTNTNTLIGLFGAESDDWMGQRVTLIPAQTDFQGKQVPCIRVSLHKPEPPKQEASVPPVDSGVDGEEPPF